MIAAQQASSLATTATVWQNTQANALLPGSGFIAGGSVQAQSPISQVSSWDPTMQAGRPTFVSAPSSFPGQPYAMAPAPAYATAVTPGSSPVAQTNQNIPNFPPMGVTQPMHQSGMLPGGVSPHGHPPFYNH